MTSPGCHWHLGWNLRQNPPGPIPEACPSPCLWDLVAPRDPLMGLGRKEQTPKARKTKSGKNELQVPQKHPKVGDSTSWTSSGCPGCPCPSPGCPQCVPKPLRGTQVLAHPMKVAWGHPRSWVEKKKKKQNIFLSAFVGLPWGFLQSFLGSHLAGCPPPRQPPGPAASPQTFPKTRSFCALSKPEDFAPSPGSGRRGRARARRHPPGAFPLSGKT